MNDRELYEKASRSYAWLSDLFHKLADSGDDNARQDQLWKEITAARASMPAVVGETGPELVNLPQGATVIPSPVPVTPASSSAPPLASSTLGGGVVNTTRPNWIAKWSGRDPSAYVRQLVQESGDKTLLIVGYFMYLRDNGSYSSGGAASPAEFTAFYSSLVEALGTKDTIVVVEPDALGHLAGMKTDEERTQRMDLLRRVLEYLSVRPNIKVYLDCSFWLSFDQAVHLTRRFAPLIDGLAWNTSGYERTEDIMAKADPVARAIGKPYVIDTSRNGNGNPKPGFWCNLTHIKPGNPPTTNTGNPLCEAFLNLKLIGESDGKGINDDGSHPRDEVPAAGEWWQDYHDAAISGVWEPFEAKYDV